MVDAESVALFYDFNDIKPDGRLELGFSFQVVLGPCNNFLLFCPGNGFSWQSLFQTFPGFHFNKTDNVFFFGNNIYFSHWGAKTGFEDGKSVFSQESDGVTLTLPAQGDSFNGHQILP